MKKIEKNLKEWIDKGIINQQQAEFILNHEKAKNENSWVLSGLLILGAVIVGLGMISTIAANWDQIPDIIKLVSNFLLLIILAYFTYKNWLSKKEMRFEVLLLSFLIHCMATIGLISQIFHSGGEFHQALMFWSLITFGAMLASRGIFVPLIWTGALLGGIITYAMISANLELIFHKNYLAVMMTSTYLCACFAVLSRGLVGNLGPTKAFRIWSLFIGLLALIAAENLDPSMKIIQEKFIPYIPGYFLALYTSYEILQNNEYKKIQRLLLISSIIIFMIPLHLPILGVKSHFVYAFFTILILLILSFFLASLKERKLFQLFLSLLGFRFLILYFQAIGGLATTGIGLIFSGGLVIYLSITWNKYKSIIANWAEGVSE